MKMQSQPDDGKKTLLFNKMYLKCLRRRDGETTNWCRVGEMKFYNGNADITGTGVAIEPISVDDKCDIGSDSDKAFNGNGDSACITKGKLKHLVKAEFNPATAVSNFKYMTGNGLESWRKRDMVQWSLVLATATNSYTFEQTSDYPIEDENNKWSSSIDLSLVKDSAAGKCMKDIECKLDFTHSSVEYDSAMMSLKVTYSNVCPDTDLVIKSTTPYIPDTAEKAITQNGFVQGYAQLHLDANYTTTKFSFDFVKTNGNAKPLHSTVLSFLDIDEHHDGSVVEEITMAGGYADYVVGSDILTEIVDGGLKLRATKPSETSALAASVSFALLDVTHLDMTFTADGMAAGGRNVMMTGDSTFITKC